MEEAQDKYKIFDTSDFQARYVLDGHFGVDNTGVVVFKKHFSFKDAVQLVLTGLLVLTLVIFVCLFAQSRTEVGTVNNKVAQLQRYQQQLSTTTCKTHQCYYETAYITQIMNDSVNPCDNFHEYACGNWDSSLPYDHFWHDTNVYTQMSTKNVYKVFNTLISRKLNDAAFAGKVRSFYYSCWDYQTRHHNKQNPLVTQVLNKSDGLAAYLFGKDMNKVKLDELLQTVNGKYQTASLFDIHLHVNPYRKDERSPYSIFIERAPIGTGMLKYSSHATNETQQVYTDFLQKVAGMILRDANIQLSDDEKQTRLSTFAQDVVEFERKMTELHLFHENDDDDEEDNDYNDKTLPPHHPENMKTLEALSKITTSFNWINLMKSVFTREFPVTRDTKVVLEDSKFLRNLTSYLDKIQRDKGDQVYKRMISNYFTWRIISFFEVDLSPEYRTLFQQLKEKSYRYSKQMSTTYFCFHTTNWAMNKGVGALFVRDHLADKGKDFIDKMFVNLKSAAKEAIKQIEWMEPATKDMAQKKVDAIVEKAGYPAEAMNDDFMNKEYESMAVTYDYFANILEALKYHQYQLTKLLTSTYNPLDFHHWGSLWGTHVGYLREDGEILVQAGRLQIPLFSADLPPQISYGAFGTHLAHEILRSFDDQGRFFNLKNIDVDSWWTTKDSNSFEKKLECISNTLRNVSNTFLADYLPYKNYPKAKEYHIRRYQQPILLDATGLKYAYEGYKIQRQQNGFESKNLPGINLSDEQLFFLSFAQSGCYKRHTIKEHIYFNWVGRLPEAIIQNAVLAQNADFARVFNCPITSKMTNNTKVCNVF